MRLSTDVLKTYPLFRDIEDEAILQMVVSVCSVRTYGPGELVIGHTDSSFDVLILIEGTARVSLYSPDGQRVGLRDLNPGMSFGELSAIDGLPRSASVEAHTPCSVAMLPRKHFLSLMQRSGAFALATSQQLAAHVRRLTTRVFEYSTMAVRQRLRAEILRLGEAANANSESALIAPAPTHAEIASRISTHREAVSREMAWLEGKGIILKQGRNLLITSRSRLQRLLEEGWND